MSETNRENLEDRVDASEEVLDYFETGIVLNIGRLAELTPILNLPALAREAGLDDRMLQTKIRHRTPLTGEETRRLVMALKKFHLATVA